MINFIYATGGREAYFKAADVRDCVVRAIANATGLDYLVVYNGINEEAKRERASKRKGKKSSARNGVYTDTAKRYIERALGWVWVPCMTIGSGCQTHIKEGELPSKGSYILNLSKHFSCWKDNSLLDTYDCSRGGSRCVYGYWREPTPEEKAIHEGSLSQEAEYKAFLESQKAELAKRREEVKRHNAKVKKSFATKINKLKAQLRKLEREMAKQLLPTPKMEPNAWATEGVKKHGN